MLQLHWPGDVHPPFAQPAAQMGTLQFTPCHPTSHEHPLGWPPALPFTHEGDRTGMLHVPPAEALDQPELHVHTLGAVQVPCPHPRGHTGTSHKVPDHPVLQLHSPG